jgi:hypothetical protein
MEACTVSTYPIPIGNFSEGDIVPEVTSYHLSRLSEFHGWRGFLCLSQIP